MIIILTIGILAIIIGTIISLFYLSKALYYFAKYKHEQVFNKNYKEYKKFSKYIDSDIFNQK